MRGFVPVSLTVLLLAFGLSMPVLGQQPKVAIHVSELTKAFETTPAGPGMPTGVDTTGKEWWVVDWHYFAMEEALKESLRADGTTFVVVTDADIAAGALLNANGTPKYPIVFSLASEAIGNNEITPLLNYVSAGGFLFVGSSAFTRNPDGTPRGDFAIATAMGLHMVDPVLDNWATTTTLTKATNHRLVSHIPSGTLNWFLPFSDDDTPWGNSPEGSTFHSNEQAATRHLIWQVSVSGATLIASGDTNLPYLTTKSYGNGQIIYDAAMQPLLGTGGWAPGMYAYGILRNAIQWAFESAAVPVVKVSPWPYQYNAAYIVRHDLESYTDRISDIESSAQAEFSVGAKGEYYFCTGALRVQLGNSPTVISGLRNAVSSYGATIGSHNGGLPNPNNPGLVLGDYDYWHWGPDEALDAQVPGYANGAAYASASISASFADIDSWLSGLNTNKRTWVAPYFNGTREGSYELLSQLGVVSAGEQKIGPFPHWTVSTQTEGKRYFITLPVSDWYIGNDVAQSMENGHTTATVDALVDYYYNLGALINLYGHQLSTDPIPNEYLQHVSAKPAIWPTNTVTIMDWWTRRSTVQISPTYSIVGNRQVLTATVSGATDPNTAIELVIPNWTVAMTGVQVKLNGSYAGPNSFRTYGQGVKVLVGTTVTNVEVWYPLTAAPTAVSDSYTVNTGTTLTVTVPGVLANDTSPNGGQMTATLITPPQHGVLNLSSTGAFTYTPASGYTGPDAFNYVATSGGNQSTLTPVNITVYPAGVLFSDDFSGSPGADPLWTTVSGTWTVGNGVINGLSPLQNYGSAYVNGNWSDFAVQAQLQFGAGAFGGGLGGRVNASTGARYSAWIYPEGSIGGSSVLKLVKFTGWTAWSGTPMAQANLPSVGSGPHTLQLKFQGNTILVLYDGVQYISVTDNGFGSTPAFTSGGISLDMWTFTQSYTMSAENVVVQASLSAQNDTYLLAENSTLTIAAPGVMGNDVGGGGLNPVPSVVASPSHGTLNFQSDGSFTYTPAANFAGSDTFTYQLTTAGLSSNVATVTITIVPQMVNSITLNPVLVASGGTAQGSVTLNVAAPAPGTTLLMSSSSPSAATVPSTITIPTGATTANFTVTGNAVTSVTPITITASYGNSSQSIGLTVFPTGMLLFGDNFSDASGPDPSWTTRAGTWNIANGAFSGSSSVNSYAIASAGGTWTDYTVEAQLQFPAGAFGGGIGGRVNPSTGARYAAWMYPEGSLGGSSQLKLVKFTGWTSWTGAPMAQASLPSVGTGPHTVQLKFQGTVIQVFVDGVPYINITDDGFGSVPALTSGGISLDMWTDATPYVMVVDNVDVQAATAVAQNDSYTMAQGTTLTVAAPGVLANDSSGSGLGSTAVLASSVSHGTLSLQSNGSFTYTPASGYVGTDTFTYQASVSGLLSNVATVTISVIQQTVTSITLNPVLLTGGGTAQGSVTLNVAAPSPGTTLFLSSTNPSAASVPATVTVPTGSTTANFTVTANTVASVTPVTITASYGNSSQSIGLTVFPAGVLLFNDNFSGAAGADPLWTTVSGTWSVANGAFNGSSPVNTYASASAGGVWTDFTVEGQVQFPAGAFGGGIGGRVDSSTGARYSVWIYPEGSPGGSAQVKLVKFTGWTAWSGTPMAQSSLPSVGTVPHMVQLKLQGTRIQVFVDGVQYIDVTDDGFGSVPALTSGGISLDMWTDAAPYVMTVDNVDVQAQ